MEKIQLVLTLISSLIVLGSTLFGFIIAFINAIKGKKIELNKNAILTALQKFIEDAEKLETLDGTGKKDYVLKQIEEFAQKNKIPFDLSSVSEAIESLVAFTKKVNPPK